MLQAKRNILIDGIKFLMAIIVALGHYGIKGKIDAGFAVTVFFLISGYYLMAGICRKNEKSSITFIKKKLKRFYLPYITGVMLLLIYNVANKAIVKKEELSLIIKYCISSLQEVFLLQGFGFDKEPVNPTMWFFSVMLISMIIIHKALNLDRRFALKYFFPLIIISSIPVFIGNVDPWGKIYGVVYIPFIRGLVSLLLGVYMYLIEDWYNTFFTFRLRYLVAALSFIGCLYVGSTSNIYILFIVLILLPCFRMKIEIVSAKIYQRLEKLFLLSDQIYFGHYLVITFLHVVLSIVGLGSIKGVGLVYLILVLAMAIFLEEFCRKAQDIIDRICSKRSNKE